MDSIFIHLVNLKDNDWWLLLYLLSLLYYTNYGTSKMNNGPVPMYRNSVGCLVPSRSQVRTAPREWAEGARGKEAALVVSTFWTVAYSKRMSRKPLRYVSIPQTSAPYRQITLCPYENYIPLNIALKQLKVARNNTVLACAFMKPRYYQPISVDVINRIYPITCEDVMVIWR